MHTTARKNLLKFLCAASKRCGNFCCTTGSTQRPLADRLSHMTNGFSIKICRSGPTSCPNAMASQAASKFTYNSSTTLVNTTTKLLEVSGGRNFRTRERTYFNCAVIFELRPEITSTVAWIVPNFPILSRISSACCWSISGPSVSPSPGVSTITNGSCPTLVLYGTTAVVLLSMSRLGFLSYRKSRKSRTSSTLRLRRTEEKLQRRFRNEVFPAPVSPSNKIAVSS
mmetsp:Transcript_4581/g.11100  ORF Transcript_4581/g.11100 Transcript_4581/m.11100 type:complete len:226 (+) Transcript_4581:353-1030(+)